MATTLTTVSTQDAIVCTTADGAEFGRITYGATTADRWIAQPIRYPAQNFRSLEGAEFYMLAMAAQDAEIMREVNTRLELAEAGEDVQALCGDATPEAAARIALMIQTEGAPAGWDVAGGPTDDDHIWFGEDGHPGDPV